MAQEKINIAALLKDCPKGTKLYSPLCGECRLQKVIDDGESPAIITEGKWILGFLKNGEYQLGGECLLFPSKEVRDWGCFRVKYAKGNSDCPEKVRELLLDNGGIDEGKYAFDNEGDYIYFIDRLDSRIKCFANYPSNEFYKYILSTGTELKLEEEQPKFKVGDVIGSISPMVVVSNYIQGVPDDYQIPLDWANDPKYDYSYASEAQIAKWNEDTLHLNHLHYSKSKRKFMHWFLPFDKVLRRNTLTGRWECDLFSYADKAENEDDSFDLVYCCVAKNSDECLPYNSDTARLIGTTNNYKEDE